VEAVVAKLILTVPQAHQVKEMPVAVEFHMVAVAVEEKLRQHQVVLAVPVATLLILPTLDYP
jgi:hypothetical protein